MAVETIMGTDGADTLERSGGYSNFFVQALGGRDLINTHNGYDYNWKPSNTTVDAGDGNDTIKNGKHLGNSCDRLSVNGGAGNDLIYNGDGDRYPDYDWQKGNYATLEGGAGKDTIWSNGDNCVIDGGAGDDSIVTYGIYSIAIKGGTGDDIIENNKDNADVFYKYTTGDGNDTIIGFNDLSTLQIDGGTGAYSTVKSGSDIIVYVGDEAITLVGAAALDELNIDGIESKPSAWRINGTTATYGTSTDTLITVSGVKSLDGISLSGTTVTVANSALNKSNVSISSGYTLALATGVDTIAEDISAWTTLSGGNVAYLAGGTGSYYSLSSDGKRVTYNASMAGSNMVELRGVTGTPSVGSGVVSLTAANFNGNISVVSNASNYGFNLSGDLAGKTFTGSAGEDSITNKGSSVLFSYNAGDGSDFIEGFRADSTLSISGGTYSSQTSGSDVIITVGEGNITLAGAASLETLNILGKLDTPADTTPADTEGKVLVNKTANAGIVGTANDDDITNRANNATIYGGGGDDIISNMRKNNVVLSGDEGNDVLENFRGKNVSLNGGAGNDDIFSDGAYTTILGGAGDDTVEIDSAGNVIGYKEGDGNDVVTGFDGNDTLIIGNGKTDTYNSKISGEDVIVTVGEGSITLKNAASLWDDTVDGGLKNIAGRYVGNIIKFDDTSTSPATLDAKIEIADATARTKAAKIVGNELDNSIIGGSGKDTLYGGDGADTLDGGSNQDKLYGGAGDDSLFGGANNDILRGEAGEDTLWGGTSNDTLVGGTEADLFIYTAGKDVITDYTAGEDVISIGSAFSNVKASISGNNNVLTIGAGTLTIKNSVGTELTIIDANGMEFSTVVGVKYFTDDDANHTLESAYFAGIATARTTAIEITGNSRANSIVGGTGKDTISGGDEDDTLDGNKGHDKLYGEDGDDTLIGGKGNDSLWGGDGADTFVYAYGDGKDMIFGFEAEDNLQIAGFDLSEIVTTTNNRTGAVTLQINSSNSITFKTYTTDVYNINGDQYTVSGNQLVKVDE